MRVTLNALSSMVKEENRRECMLFVKMMRIKKILMNIKKSKMKIMLNTDK